MDFTKSLQELNLHHAIKGKVTTQLKDIFQLLTKERLNSIASNHELSGRSKMNKQNLADALYRHLTDVNVVRAVFLMTETEEWELVNRLLKAPYVQDDTLYPGVYLFLMEKGLLYSFYNEGKLYFVIPEEIKQAYRSISQKAFLEERNRSKLILQYINASVNLYGICPQAKVIEIFNLQNNSQLTEAEFYNVFLKSLGREQTWYSERGNLHIDYFGYENKAEKAALLERVKDKPYYIPDKQEFLKYAQSDYFEMTPQLVRLHDYISRHLCKDTLLVDSLVSDIQLACSMEEPLAVIMSEFEQRDIHFYKKEQLQTIFPLIVDVYNHTRLWSNRGHTPDELGSSSTQIKDKSNVIYLDRQAVSVKVGRNDPCPCGSGKKHKKCCGQ